MVDRNPTVASVVLGVVAGFISTDGTSVGKALLLAGRHIGLGRLYQHCSSRAIYCTVIPALAAGAWYVGIGLILLEALSLCNQTAALKRQFGDKATCKAAMLQGYHRPAHREVERGGKKSHDHRTSTAPPSAPHEARAYKCTATQPPTEAPPISPATNSRTAYRTTTRITKTTSQITQNPLQIWLWVFKPRFTSQETDLQHGQPCLEPNRALLSQAKKALSKRRRVVQ